MMGELSPMQTLPPPSRPPIPDSTRRKFFGNQIVELAENETLRSNLCKQFIKSWSNITGMTHIPSQCRTTSTWKISIRKTYPPPPLGHNLLTFLGEVKGEIPPFVPLLEKNTTPYQFPGGGGRQILGGKSYHCLSLHRHNLNHISRCDLKIINSFTSSRANLSRR